MSLDAYRERVEKLARERSGEPIYNASIEHAAVIVEKMFAHAHEAVRILSGKLNARVYGTDEVIKQAELFLADETHRIQILLEDANVRGLRGHPFFDRFSGYENVEVRQVPQALQPHFDYHFLVMDRDSYRFEKDKTEYAAVAAFGDKEGAENILTIFEILWDASAPVQLPQLQST